MPKPVTIRSPTAEAALAASSAKAGEPKSKPKRATEINKKSFRIPTPPLKVFYFYFP
jgi:hypothetical protein